MQIYWDTNKTHTHAVLVVVQSWQGGGQLQAGVFKSSNLSWRPGGWGAGSKQKVTGLIPVIKVLMSKNLQLMFVALC